MSYITFHLALFICILINMFLNGHSQGKSVYIEGYDRLKYSVEQIKVNSGATVEITLKTVSSLPESQMAHNWVLLKKSTDVVNFVNKSAEHKENEYIEPKLENKIIAATSMLGGGEKETITFTAPQSKGVYFYVCTFPAHYMAGMKGRLIVE